MRNRTLSILVGALLMLGTVVPAFGLWGRFPNDKPVEADNWPREIVKATNAHKRVYGAGAYDAGWTFYFKGTTKDVNAFMAKVAEEKGVALEVVLIPEAGTATPDPFERNLKVEYEWALHLYLYRDRVFIEPEKGEADAQYQKRRDAELVKLPEYGAVVTIHCAGAINPAALKIPLPFKASVGGRLASLADFHNQRKSQLQVDGKPEAGEPPTDMTAAETSRSALFGGPSTKPADGHGG
jgi:hypothetical protein